MSVEDQFASHELRIFSMLARAGFAPRVIYDIGAANGTWSALISSVFPDAAFHLFEPLADLYPAYNTQLKDHMRYHPEFTLHPVALGDKTGMVTMRLHADGFSSTVLNLESHPEFKNSCQVPQYALDEYVQRSRLPLPEILKLDTQGAERLILSRASASLAHASVVFAESWLTRGYGPDTPLLTELQEMLTGYDYQLAELGYRFYDDGHRLYGCDAFFFRRPFAQRVSALMPAGPW